jgi:hypothetical protein
VWHSLGETEELQETSVMISSVWAEMIPEPQENNARNDNHLTVVFNPSGYC